MTSNNGFKSKSILRPSSLAQHTLNFNKILEQKPTPKIDESELKLLVPDTKPTISTSNSTHSISTVTDVPVVPLPVPTPTTTGTATESTVTDQEQVNPEPENKVFVFGEKLSERVINTDNPSPTESDEQSKTEKNQTEEPTHQVVQTADTTDNGITILKMNCKLFQLDTEKTDWTERGFGLLKVFKINNGYKVCMWTDKSYRLILNIKLFENMLLDKPNRKSIRLNGYDNGMLRIFLLKMANANDCDDLYDLLYNSVSDIKRRNLEQQVDSQQQSQVVSDELFKCECLVDVSDTNEEGLKCNLEVVRDTGDVCVRLRSIHNDEINLNKRLEAIALEKKADTKMVIIKSEGSVLVYNLRFADEYTFDSFFEIIDENISNSTSESSAVVSSELSAVADEDEEDEDNGDNNDEASNKYQKRGFVDDDDEEEQQKKAKLSN